MRAQLILVGGRPMPNVLTIIHQQPELIVAICSIQSFKKDWSGLRKIVEKLIPSCKIEEKVIDGYLLDQIKSACKSELPKSQDWLFNITNATSIMSIGAYEVAKENSRGVPIKCWYLDTADTRVITLVGEQLDEKQSAEIFSIKVDQYVAAYNYALGEGNLKDHRDRYMGIDWLNFAEFLGKSPDQTKLLKLILGQVSGSPRKGTEDIITRPYYTTCITDEAYNFLEKAQLIGLLSKLHRKSAKTIDFNLSERQYKFLNGTWLELYVWQAANKLDIFDDCQWSKEILDGDKKEISNIILPYKELDVSMTYKAQLIIVECKTGKETSQTKTLDDIVTIADLLGGRFVTKLLVINSSPSDMPANDNEESFDKLLGKALQRRIRIVTREELPTIGDILNQEAINPTYSRG